MQYRVTFTDGREPVIVEANSASANSNSVQFWQDINLNENNETDYNRPYVPPRLVAIFANFDSVTLVPEDPAI